MATTRDVLRPADSIGWLVLAVLLFALLWVVECPVLLASEGLSTDIGPKARCGFSHHAAGGADQPVLCRRVGCGDGTLSGEAHR